jgi:hypothetical protein
MLDITAEIIRQELLTPAVVTSTVTGAAVNLAGNVNTGDLDALVLELQAIGGTTPNYSFQLQDSANGTTGWAAVATTNIMPNTSAVITANGVTTLAIDPRSVRQYIRLVLTVTGTTPTAVVIAELLYRPVQNGFNQNSG